MPFVIMRAGRLSKFRGDLLTPGFAGAELAGFEEGAADGGEAGIRPDVGFAMEDAGGVDEAPAAGEGNAPIQFMQCGSGECPRQEDGVLRLRDGLG